MKPVPEAIGVVRLSPAKTAWLHAHIAAALVALGLGLHAIWWAPAVGLTFLTLCLGHSVGLHRGLIHRTYDSPRAVQRALVALFVLTGLGGPLSWIRLHRVRDYWQNRGDCPPYFAYEHTLARDFVWNLHLSFTPRSWQRYGLDPKLESDRYLRVFERTWWLVNLLFYATLVVSVGWEAALVLGPTRVAGSVLGHWFIGFWTHKHGSRRFRIVGAAEEGTNSVLLGWISFTEGFHNNHHAHPDSARMGVRGYELDIGWLAILALERLGLVRDVKAWSRGNAEQRVQGSRDEEPRVSAAQGAVGGRRSSASRAAAAGTAGTRPTNAAKTQTMGPKLLGLPPNRLSKTT